MKNKEKKARGKKCDGKQETVIKTMVSHSNGYFDGDEAEDKHHKSVNRVIARFEKDGYSVSNRGFTRDEEKWYSYGDHGTHHVFRTRLCFRLRRPV